PQHQNADDAERDDAHRGAIEEQVHQVVGCKEHRVQRSEHNRYDNQSDGYGQHAQIAGADAVDEAPDDTADAFVVPHTRVAAVQVLWGGCLLLTHGDASTEAIVPGGRLRFIRRDAEFSAAPVMAATNSWLDASG